MTIQQAIWTLIDCRRLLINGLVLVQAEEITEAFDMAIEALNNVMDSENDAVKTEDDVIKRQDAVETVKELNRIINEDRNGTVCTLDVLSRIKKLPSATCDDCIWHVCNYNKIDWDGEDGYISRQDAVSEIDEWIQMATGNGTDMAIKDFLSFLKERIESLPSAEPKTGKWVLDPNGMDWNIPAWRCSECGFVANYIGVEANGLGNNPMNWAGSKFCPQCGARMKGADDEREDIQSTDE